MRVRKVEGGRSMSRPAVDQTDLLDEPLPAPEEAESLLELTGVAVAGGSLTGVRGEAEVTRSSLDSVDFSQSRLRPMTLADVELRNVDVSNAQWHDVTARRVEMVSGRAVGFGVSFDLAWDLYVEDCRLDYAGIHIERVRGLAVFRGCTFREARIGGNLSGAVFLDCDFTDTQFDATGATNCDLRSCRLGDARGLHTLRGAIVDAEQVVSMAGRLAVEAGLRIGE